MAEFTLGRNYTHRSTLGHIITFIKGQPTWVPPVCHREVVAVGATPTEDVGDLFGTNEQVRPDLSASERNEQLVIAFKLLQSRNARGDFTGQGIPSIPAIKKIIDDFDPEKKEVEVAWREYLDEQNSEQ